MEADRRWLHAGSVGRPHGLDGSFYVHAPASQLLNAGADLQVDGAPRRVVRRAGTAQRPILRLEGCETREAAQSLHRFELLAPRADAPALDPDEFWVDDLVGCQVRDGERVLGAVRRVLALPSCEVLEVERCAGAGDLLVPLVGDAVGEVDVQRREIEVHLRFLDAE